MQLGQRNRLTLKQVLPAGALFEGGRFGDIFMPKSHINKTLSVGEQHSVFVFLDNQDQLIATF